MTINKVLQPFTVPSTPVEEMVEIASAKGCTLVDSAGNEYLDALASLWLCQIGHGNQRVINAIGDQLQKLQTYNLFGPFTNAPAQELAAKILELSPHPDGRVALSSSGSEAVDSSLKLARRYHHLRGDDDRQIMVRRDMGFHGTNIGGTSMQGIAPNREGWGNLLPDVMEIPKDDIEPAAQMFAEHGERIAAVICEPVQGGGGVIMPPDGYLEGLRRLCDQHGALLIFDEVICGFGRTGSWFGAQTFGVTPDLMTFAKGVTSGYLPLSGVIVSRRVCDEFEKMTERLLHGYTYSGHPVSCAAGLANIGVIEDEGLVERANHIGEKMAEGFEALKKDGVIPGYRGIGGIWAADVDKDANEVCVALMKRGVVVRPLIEAIAFCPPLIMTDAEIGSMFDRFDEAVRSV